MRPIHIILALIMLSNQGLISDELKLTHPNGGEVFEAGAETTISWEGVPDTTKIKLEFSPDNGVTWSTVADSTVGLSFDWKVPQIESDSCLFLVSHKVISKDSAQEEGSIIWQKSFGGSSIDRAFSVAQTFDGGFIVAGSSESSDGDISNPLGNNDYWIVKLKNDGELEWEKSFGGKLDDVALSINQSLDGGYIVTGYSKSSEGDISNPKGDKLTDRDYWIIKLKNDGELEWEKSYGGSGNDFPYSITQTSDGGYIVAGYSESSDGDISNPLGDRDYWIVKLKNDGELEWEKSYGGSSEDFPKSITQTFDSGYIVAGNSFSNDGDVSNPKGGGDYWILKLNRYGELEWQKSYGGSGNDEAYSIIQTLDSGYIVAGYSNSPEFDNAGPNGFFDYWILKLKNNGDLEWAKSFGIIGSDVAYSIIQTLDGDYIVAGNSSKFVPDNIIPRGNYWVLKLKEDGKLDWHKSYGGKGSDVAQSIVQTLNGNYLVAGYSNSFDGDITNPKGGYDSWILKIAGSSQPLQSDTSDAVFSIKAPEETIIPDFDYYAYTNEQNSSVIVTVILEENTDITLEIYDVLGRRIVDLYSGEAAMGNNEYTVNINDFQSGRYYIKLTTPTITKTEIIEIVR